MVSKSGSLETPDGVFDTHPTLAARARALGVDPDEALVGVDQIEPAAVTLLSNAPELSVALQGLLTQSLIKSGAARPPRDPSRPNFVQKKRLQRIQQAEARKRRGEAAAGEGGA